MYDMNTNLKVSVTIPEGLTSEQTQSAKRSGITSGDRIRGKNGDNVLNVNFKSVAKLGLSIRTTRMASEVIGAYSNNRLRQRRFQSGMLMVQYAIGIAKFGLFGATYAVGDLGYRSLMYSVDAMNKTSQARDLQRMSGNNRYDGNRKSGGMF